MSNPEMRLNPFTGEWIIYSSSRQGRPDREESGCPFCEGSEEVPSFDGPIRITNKFPALSLDATPMQYTVDSMHIKRGAYGNCDIVVYTSEHDSKFIDLSENEILLIFSTWMTATKDLSKDSSIKYILPFENYGVDVGASIIHPHGQIYSFPFIPSLIKNELLAYNNYRKSHSKCMICDYIDYELRVGERIVFSDDYIVALIPYFAKHAYDVYIYPKRHYGSLHQSTRRELDAFSNALPRIIKALNSVLEKEVSYSLSLHQIPVNSQKISTYHQYFKIHTPQRNPKSLKLLGAVESSLNTFINGTLPEIAAKNLRTVLY